MTSTWKLIGAVIALVLFAGGLALSSRAEAQVATELDCRGCVNKRQLGKKSVTAAKIKDQAVVRRAIRDGAVNSSKIADGSVAPVDLATGAKPAGLAFSSGDQAEDIGGTDEAVRSVTINAPTAGNVLVTASWHLTGLDVLARCSITTGSTVDTTHAVDVETAGSILNVSGAAVRAFPVGAGASTFNLVCIGLIGTPNIRDSSIVATFVPGSY